jgi:hypothetical protein
MESKGGGQLCVVVWRRADSGTVAACDVRGRAGSIWEEETGLEMNEDTPGLALSACESNVRMQRSAPASWRHADAALSAVSAVGCSVGRPRE